MCMDILCARTSVYHVHAWRPWKPEEGVESLELELYLLNWSCR